MYVAIFQTPLGWALGKPLVVANAPEKVDAIVVLGGGVGESGKAGQGYEERVSKAVELYKDGYAKHIIYSTGYTYVLKEAAVMAALSAYLGVDPADITVEERSRDTYQNIVNVGGILKERGWHKIIIVSSKYHMRRLELVCRKNIPDVSVLYVPTISSYYAGAHVLLRHLHGFLHEYCALVAYKIKGYL